MITYQDKEKEAELYQAIVNLTGKKDFEIYMAWFRDSLDLHRIENDTMTDTSGRPILSRNQGKCINLGEILDTHAKAKETLAKIIERRDSSR